MKPRFKRLSKFLICVVLVLCTGWVSAGEVTGTVKWDGKGPKPRALKMDADPVCMTHHKDKPAYAENFVMGENGGLANVLVHVVEGLPDKKYDPPAEAAVLDQKGCIYVPHVMGVMAGQKVKILNSDNILHNVNVQAKVNRGFNLGMPKGTTEAEKVFSRPEHPIKLKCNAHPWMTGYLAVMSHPYFAVTGKDGSFSIKGLPPGTYKIEAWHEHKRLGTKTAQVTIGSEGDVQTTDFTYARAPKK